MRTYQSTYHYFSSYHPQCFNSYPLQCFHSHPLLCFHAHPLHCFNSYLLWCFHSYPLKIFLWKKSLLPSYTHCDWPTVISVESGGGWHLSNAYWAWNSDCNPVPCTSIIIFFFMFDFSWIHSYLFMFYYLMDTHFCSYFKL